MYIKNTINLKSILKYIKNDSKIKLSVKTCEHH